MAEAEGWVLAICLCSFSGSFSNMFFKHDILYLPLFWDSISLAITVVRPNCYVEWQHI